MLNLCRQTDREMDGRTTVKQYAPNLLIWGHKKFHVTNKIKFVSGRKENTVGKGENSGYWHFLFSSFHKTIAEWWLKLGLVMSNFSFSRSVFKRLVPQTLKNQSLFGKGLTHKVFLTEWCLTLVSTIFQSYHSDLKFLAKRLPQTRRLSKDNLLSPFDLDL